MDPPERAEAVITRMAGKGTPVIGVCGGFQMLGTSLDDPHGVRGGRNHAGNGALTDPDDLRGEENENESNRHGEIFGGRRTG